MKNMKMSKEMREQIDRVKNFKQFVNENKISTNDISNIQFSIKKIYDGEVVLKFKNYLIDIDKLLDDMNIYNEISDIIKNDDISGNFGKYNFEYDDFGDINKVIEYLISKGFKYKDDKTKTKNDSIIYHSDFKKISDKKYSFYTSGKKNVVTEKDYIKIGNKLEIILKDYLDYSDDSYILINEMENFHIIVTDDELFFNEVKMKIEENLEKGNF